MRDRRDVSYQRPFTWTRRRRIVGEEGRPERPESH